MYVRFQPVALRGASLPGLLGLEQAVNSLLDGALDGGVVSRHAGVPAIRVAEDSERTVLSAELPGVKKEDIKIFLDEGILTISGERKKSGAPEGSKVARNEIWTGPFSRSFRLPHDVNGDEMSAELSDGILTVVLPKAEEARPREITIQ